MNETIWLVEDDSNLRKVLRAMLAEDGYDVREFPSADDAAKSLPSAEPAVILTDLQMPGMDGIELLRRVTAASPETPVVILSAHGTIDRAVEAMKANAYDFLVKPVTSDKLLIVIRNAVEAARLKAEVTRLRVQKSEGLRALIVGESSAMRKVRELVSMVSLRDSAVLITGETGAGKEVVARAIHASSTRSPHPFVAVNCSAIPENLFETELFGCRKGAFTGALCDRKGLFQSAHRGTIFLDEIGDLPLQIQAKLLRVLQDKIVTPVGGTDNISVDCRIIAATNRDLDALRAEQRFRDDLYFRLNVISITLPPLRDRTEDLLPLCGHILHLKCGDPPEITPAAMKRLESHDWPGNVRELENVLERALLYSGEDSILPEHIVFSAGKPAGSGLELRIPDEGISLEDVERRLILEVLERTGDNRTHAARLLGITRSALLYRMEKHGIRTK